MNFLPVLPNRLPDESYPSFLFRLHLLIGKPTLEGMIRELFGERLILSHVSPTGISQLVSLIPASSGISVDTILSENTAFPYHRPFVTDQDPETFKAEFLGNKTRFGNAFYLKPGIRLGLHKWEPRFCSVCLKEDEKTWGISYFHRSHQIPEVVVCATHGRPLRNSCATCGPLPWHHNNVWSAGRCRNCQALLADQCAGPTAPTNSIVDLRIADVVQQLLLANLPKLNDIQLRSTYVRALTRHGLIAYDGKVRTRELADALTARFGLDYLEQLGVSLRSANTATPRWVSVLLRSTRPLDHCILIILLFGSLDNFLESYRATAKEGGWSDKLFDCAFQEYSKAKLQSVSWKRSAEIPFPIPISELQPKKEIVTGSLANIASLFRAGLSWYRISILIKRNVANVHKFAEENPDLEKIRADKFYEEKFARHKKRLEEFLSRQPNGTLKQFQVYRGTRDDWLERNESAWLLERFKKQACLQANFPEQSEDECFKKLLANFLETEYGSADPRRLSLSRIRRELKFKRVIEKGAASFPRTWDLLTTHIETPEQFRVRLVKQAYAQASDKAELSPVTLLALAGIDRRDRHRDHAYAAAVEIIG